MENRHSRNSYPSHNGRPDSNENWQSAETAEKWFQQHMYKSEWITQQADKDLVAYAEEAGKFMVEKELTKSKIRNIYGEIKRIDIKGFEEAKSSFFLLKAKMAYAVGRDRKNEGLRLFQLIFDRCWQDVSDQEKSYKNFCRFIEAILVYHRAHGGKD
ncbi:MAG: type III-A CRISPR-associated protein Csm2 [Tannerellaceae bacterium]|nr:type III-A CRISPR-associated protein Csm2 [Tannerellaceae bacterium]